MKKGHGAKAVWPAGVAFQQDHPSNVGGHTASSDPLND